MGEHQGFIDKIAALIGATGLGFLWFFLIAVWGGTASYVSRLRKSKAPFSIMELIGEWTVSAFAGLITALFCSELQFSFYVTAAAAGIAGHMGGRAIALTERALLAFLEKRTGVSFNEDKPH